MRGGVGMSLPWMCLRTSTPTIADSARPWWTGRSCTAVSAPRSGYAAPLIAKIAQHVYTIERYSQLAVKAAATLAAEGFDNVHVLHGDGTLGWPEHAPFDATVVAAGGPRVPESLKHQLRIGGRMVIPVGSPDRRTQELLRGYA